MRKTGSGLITGKWPKPYTLPQYLVVLWLDVLGGQVAKQQSCKKERYF